MSSVMSSSSRVKHEISFGQRLANEAQRAREIITTVEPTQAASHFIGGGLVQLSCANVSLHAEPGGWSVTQISPT